MLLGGGGGKLLLRGYRRVIKRVVVALAGYSILRVRYKEDPSSALQVVGTLSSRVTFIFDRRSKLVDVRRCSLQVNLVSVL